MQPLEPTVTGVDKPKPPGSRVSVFQARIRRSIEAKWAPGFPAILRPDHSNRLFGSPFPPTDIYGPRVLGIHEKETWHELVRWSWRRDVAPQRPVIVGPQQTLRQGQHPAS